jgi:hypothetical protein
MIALKSEQNIFEDTVVGGRKVGLDLLIWVCSLTNSRQFDYVNWMHVLQISAQSCKYGKNWCNNKNIVILE